MKTYLLAVLFALMPFTVHAQETSNLRFSERLFVTSVVSDWTSTAYCTAQKFCKENDPEYSWAERSFGSPAMVAIGAGSDLLGVWVIHKWIGPKHPKVIAVSYYIASGFRFYLASKNIGVAQEARSKIR